MSQCVPSWDLDDNPISSKHSLRSHSNPSYPDVPMLDYEVAELTWENGQLAMHGLGPRKNIPSKLTTTTTPSPTSPIQNNNIKYAPGWPDKPRASTGTLESIVNQATRSNPPTTIPLRKSLVASVPFGDSDELVPWFHHHRSPSSNAAATATMTMDSLVPCSNRTTDDQTTGTPVVSTCVVGCSTGVGSCSAPATRDNKGAKRPRVGVPVDWSGRPDVQSASGSATFGRESQQVTLDTCERDFGGGTGTGTGGVGFTSTSFAGSQTQDNTSYGKPANTNTNTCQTATADENDSVCHSRPQREAGDKEDKKKGNGKSSVSTKRNRAAAIHNQSERKRRDKINQRMKTLQKLVPNSSKTDKASMLDEVIDYLKQLQAQVQMMSRMNMQPMMLPMAMQQQLQMSMMAPLSMGMGMGMGMGIGMDMNTIAGRPNIPGISPVLHPSAAFMPITSWDGSSGGDRLSAPSAALMPDPFSAFLASQPITMDAYSRMAAMCQQLHQPHPASSSKS